MEKYMIKCRFCRREFPFEKLGYHMRKDHADLVIEDLMLRVGELEIKIEDLSQKQHSIVDGKVRVRLSSETINLIVRDLSQILAPKMAAMLKQHHR